LASDQRLLRRDRGAPRVGASAIAVAGGVAVAAGLGAVGADSRWLAALGREIVDGGGVPQGIPFASAPSEDWPNVLVAAELLFHWFHALGERGFLFAQLAAVAVGFGVLAHDSRRSGASDTATGLVLLGVVIGAFTAVAVVRLQLFSIALFPVTMWLLRRETRNPSRGIWLIVPLIAIWGNLHGAVLVGLAAVGAYLVFERVRVNPFEALLVGVTSVLALLANPALLRTVEYYRGVLTNEAARRGFGLWEPISLGSPFDLMFLAVAAALLVLALRSRPRVWELVALAGLTVLTLRTARSGVWLLFAAAAPAARALPTTALPRRSLATAVAVALASTIAVGMVRGPRVTGASSDVLEGAIRAADGTPILAEALLAEQVALAGGTVWLANPLDAFEPQDQRLYLNWLEGRPSGDDALADAVIVLVHQGSDADERLRSNARFRRFDRSPGVIAYRAR
jgi:hypothetical protein